MARTKSSRGVAPFKLRSGNSPLPLFGGLVGKLFSKNKNNAEAGSASSIGGGGGSSDEKLQAISEIISTDGEGTNPVDDKKSKILEGLEKAKELAGGLFSDIRLKEKIEKVGNSPSGIPIYEFNYIGQNDRYSGTMAQDLLKMGIDAGIEDESGYYKVNYNNIDINMYKI